MGRRDKRMALSKAATRAIVVVGFPEKEAELARLELTHVGAIYNHHRDSTGGRVRIL